MDTRRRRNNKQKGQSMVEYALVLVLVAVVAIAALSLVGPAIGRIFGVAVGAAGGHKNAPAAPGAGDTDVIFVADVPPFSAGNAVCQTDATSTTISVHVQASADIGAQDIIISILGRIAPQMSAGSAANLLVVITVASQPDKTRCPNSIVINAKRAVAIAPVVVAP